MGPKRLGRVQLLIMQVLWERGSATAREITDALNAESPIAHSTVQTLLRKLEAKGVVDHTEAGRVFVFRPTVEPDNVRKTAARDLIERVFDGSPADLVAWLLKQEDIPDDELRRIRELVEESAGADQQAAEEVK